MMNLDRFRLVLAALVLMIGACGHARADDAGAPDPELERRALKLPEGWEINLFAAEPMIVKPIQMNFDANGRLWVCSSSIYPQIRPGKTADDKVFVLDDPHGTGKAETSNVFAEGLLIPTGIEVGDGGVYVANSTEIVHLRDTRGTGKADERRVVLSGFGTEDTHHIVHTFRWGFDGRLYFNQSIYIHSHLETPWGTQHLLGSGTWRFDTRALRLDVLMRGLVNPWGLAFDRWGRSFETDGAGGQGVNYVFPGAAFESAVGVGRTMPGLNPHSPKYCGAEILSGRQVPDDWQGNLLTSDFRASRVCRFELTEDGAGFRSKQLSDFITSGDGAFRPVDIKMGPDGAIYIADWYNPIINHGEVDFRDPRRDHAHGRIWRITAKGRPLVDRPRISAAPVEALLDALKLPEDYARLRARRIMRERGAEQVLPALQHWVKALKSKDPETEHQRLEALWTYQCIDVAEPTLLRRVLKSDDPRARAAAVRVCSRWADQLDDVMELLEAAVADDDPRVRLEAVRALVAVEVPRSMVIATRVLDKPMDPFLDYALWRAANELQPIWMPAMQSGQLSDWEKPAHLTFALQAVKSPAALATLVEQLRSGKLPPEARPGVIDLIASIDPDHQADTLFNLAVGKDITDAGTRVRLLAALERIARERGAGSVKDTVRIATLFDDPDESLQAAALRLAGFWKLEGLRPQIVKRAEGSDRPAPIRAAAMRALAALGGAESLATLRQFADPPNSPATREIAVGALAGQDLSEAARRAADLLGAGLGADPSNLLAAFRQRDGGTDALAHALAGHKVPPDVAKLGLRYLQSAGGTDQMLMDAIRASIGITSGPTRLTPEQMKQTIADMLAKGDAARGERVFRRQDTGCFQCHAIGGVGGSLAPDLGSVGAASPPDYLIDSVLDPNKAVKDGYNGFTVATKSGEIYSGIKVREDKQELVLRDAAHDEISIPTASIRQQREVGSLMPTGLADSLTRDEFLDLARFLSELGKPGTYALGTGPVVRRWRTMDAPQSLPPGQAPAVAPDEAGWKAAYSLVSGELPPESLAPSKGTIVFARCQIDVRSAGPARLLLNSAQGLRLWIDGRAIDPKEDLTIDLPVGVRSLIFRVDVSARGPIGLRAELADVNGAHASAVPVGGR